MGYIRHHAIVVTSHSEDLINKALEKATQVFETIVSDVVESNTNGYYSFFIGPDGSKEGWAESNKGDDDRTEFISWINEQRYEDGSNSISYAELFYGDDNKKSGIVNHN